MGGFLDFSKTLLSIALLVAGLSPLHALATLCCDGTISNSTGKGTCSYHGGVCDSLTTYQCNKPLRPNFLSASDGVYEDKIVIYWSSVIGADYYRVYAKLPNTTDFVEIDGYNQSLTYTYFTTDSNEIVFKVVACNRCGCGYGAIDEGSIQKPQPQSPEILCSHLQVIDGDTLQYRQITYRLYGIDAPESYDGRKMEYDASRCGVTVQSIKEAGKLANEFLSAYLQNIDGECSIESRYSDRYGREVAIIYLPDGTSLNEEIIAYGYAIAWDRYIQEETIQKDWNAKELNAAQMQKGLWSHYCKLMNCITQKSYSCYEQNEADPVTKIVDTLMQSGDGIYELTGYFAPYRFGDDPKSNWTFTFVQSGDTYQLLGDTSSENISKVGIFGWKKVDVIPNPPQFYMVHYDNTPFGWIVFSIDNKGNCKNVYKLAGQDPSSKSFSYDIDSDGKIDRLKAVGCRLLQGERVKFFINKNQGE